jgi:hypothetical protein
VIFAVGQQVGFVPSANGAYARVLRNTAAVIETTDLPRVQTPLTMAVRGNRVFTIATQPHTDGFYYLAGAEVNGALLYQAMVETAGEQPYAITYEPISDSLWVSLETTVLCIDPMTAMITATIPITSDGDPYKPWGLTTQGGKVYVAATFTGTGRLFEIDPVTDAITRVSTGTDIAGASDVAFDGASTFYVTAGQQVPGATPGLFTVSLSSFVAAPLTLTGGDALYDPRWVICAFERVFVSEAKSDATPRLVSVLPSGAIAAERTFPGSGFVLGKPGVDIFLLWAPNPNDGTVTMLEPLNLDDLVTVQIDGEPHAAAVLIL